MQEKHIRPHSPQRGPRTGRASPNPTEQTSLRRKFTPRAQKSRHFIKDGHRTQQTQLPPPELGERSVLSMEGPKKQANICMSVPSPAAAGRGTSSLPRGLLGNPDARESAQSIRKRHIHKPILVWDPALQPLRVHCRPAEPRPHRRGE